MDPDEIVHRFAHHAPDDEKQAAHARTRRLCQELAITLNVTLPEGCEKALAMTKLEEVMFWGNAAIARAS